MARHAALETFGRSGNPVFGDKFNQSQGFVGSERMTLDGTVNKTGILLGLCFFGAIISWNIPNPLLMFGGALVGFGLAMYTSFVPRNAGITAPIYAFLKGLFLGGISLVLEMQYPGIAIQAVGLTFGTLASLLFFYKSGLIKPTENYRLMIFSATFGIMILYLVNFVMSFFGAGIGFIHSNGIFGIGFSLFVVGVAALNLVLDFDFIEQGAENSLPKYMEWYGAFSLMVTLIWLYLEILRLLAKLRSR
tara:strand:- start:852 stop:1595 length:744 start_codon:yes stop_codon:yes gene_type:complete